MQLKVKILGIESGGKPVVFLSESDANEIGVNASGRVKLISDKTMTAIVNISTTYVKKGFVGINNEVKRRLDLKNNSAIDVELSPFPNSLQFIRNKLSGKKLMDTEIKAIIRDVVDGKLNENEITAFVTALHIQGLILDEATSLAVSIVETGKQLKLEQKIIVDKHSIGGVPGDKTTLLVVPIIASAGLTIPKTSSRAITSAAGTADRAEALMPVDLTRDEMQTVVKKCNGCIVWGGALELAPADDIFIRTEYSLYIDPLLLPSIMSKKKAVGVTHLVVDIPTGRGAKVKTIGEADLLAKDIIELGRRLKIRTSCTVTYGEQPVGFTIGPRLEAKEALEVLMNKLNSPDLVDKACHIAGAIFEITGKKNGYEIARKILDSGKAEKKLREIIGYQGGNSELEIDDLAAGKHVYEVKARTDGHVLWMDNNTLVRIARAAGAPKDKAAGVIFNKKIGDSITKNETLFTIYAEKAHKISRAEQILLEEEPIGVGKRAAMLIHHIQEPPIVGRAFTFDR